MKIFSRVIVLLLCLSLLLPSVISCGNEEPTNDDSNQTENKNPDNGNENSGSSDGSDGYARLSVENNLAYSPIVMRSFYPDYNALIARLLQLKGAVGAGLNDQAAIRSELIQALHMAENLDLYYDYYNHTAYVDGDNVYGARPGDHPFGGGSGYTAVGKYHSSAADDNYLNVSASLIQSGEIIFIVDNTMIDLSDFLLAGDSNGFVGDYIPYQWTVAEGVTWIGSRGVDGKVSAILRVTSHSDCSIVVGPGATLSGLVIEGPDRGLDAYSGDENLSIGIVVQGDGAVIENCEISGFGSAAVRVVDSKDVIIRNCHIHDSVGEKSGYGILVENSTVEIYENLFSALNTVVSISGDDAQVDFHDNVDAGNIVSSVFKIFQGTGKDADFPLYRKGVAKLSIKNNTLLSLTDLIKIGGGLPVETMVENNLFAYPEAAYGAKYFQYDKVGGALFDSRIIFKNNVFDIKNPLVLSKSSSAKRSPENALLGGFSEIVSDGIEPFALAKNDAVSVEYEGSVRLPVVSAVYYTEDLDAGYKLIRALLDADTISVKTLCTDLSSAIEDIGGFGNYLQYEDQSLVSVVVDGKRYGAYSETDPIGGGVGYSDIFTTGDYVVKNEGELFSALEKVKSGEVIFIPGGTYINISDCDKSEVRTLVIPAGVTLASDRGRIMEDGTVSTGAVIANSYNGHNTGKHNGYMLVVGGEGVRITGLVFKGPDSANHIQHCNREDNAGNYYWWMPCLQGILCQYDNCEFDNLEVSGFNTYGIRITNEDDPVENTTVHHSYIHHCQKDGLGYGIRIDSAFPEISYNMFNYNRHTIASAGVPTDSYIAENNIEMGDSLSHYFDMHGGSDRKDGTDIGGGYIRIRNNSFLGDKRPFVQRGIPEEEQIFEYNIAYQDLAFCGFRLGIYGSQIPHAKVGSNIWDLKSGNTKPVTGNGRN